MINKQQAATLWAFDYKLVDKEDRMFAIDSVHETCFTVKNEFHVKAIQYVKIGTDYKIICRPLSQLTDVKIEELDTLHDFSKMDFRFIKLNPNRYPTCITNKLKEWHFDIFNLPEKAIKHIM